MNKTIIKSKTFWVNAIAVLSTLIPGVRDFIATNPEGSVGVLTAINVVVRFFTKGKVTLFSEQ